MKLNDINDGLAKILSVDKPWVVGEVNVFSETKVIDIHIGFERGSKFECSVCNKLCNVHDSNIHRIRHLDCFDYRSYLNVKVPRTKCDEHGVKVIKALPWGHTGRHYSFFFEQLIMRLTLEMSMSAVSKELGEPDTNLWHVFKHYVYGAVKEQIVLKDVKRIGVDETSNKKGHDYVTIFTDLDSGDVILVLEGRKKEVFQSLYGWLFDKGGHPKNIELISMDMSKSFKAGSRAYFANAEIVFDRFHIKKAVNEAVDKVRKTEIGNREELKKTKYIWLKNEQNLTEYQRVKLTDFLLDSTLLTAQAYQMKIGFDTLWSVQTKAIEPLLQTWLEHATLSKLKPFLTLCKTIRNNYKGIVKSMQTGITNAAAEGLNSIIQMAKSRARGFRNIENFKAMIYYLGNDFNFKTHYF